MDNSIEISAAAQKFLRFLKYNGPQSTSRIGNALNMTSEAARQQLTKMEEKGVVKSHSKSEGVGRPSKVWSLTDRGNAEFPDRHSFLTVQLLENIRGEWGEEALEKLIAAQGRETLSRYNARIDDNDSLENKIKKLATIRSEEGYMAEWKKESDGYLLIENHCPICDAAAVCQGFCKAELQIFHKILGREAQITRESHIQTGARRCAYRITEADRRPRGQQ